MIKSWTFPLFYLFWTIPLFAQNTYKIGMLIEGDEVRNAAFEAQVKEEVSSLMDTRKNIVYDMHYVGFDINEISHQIDKMMGSDVDVIITLGLIPSNELVKRPSHAKPSIAGIVLNDQLQGVSRTAEGTSGKHNLTYILSPFDVHRDLEVFKTIQPYERLGVIADQQLISSFPLLKSYFNDIDPNHEIIIAEPGKSIELPSRVDAIYVLPLSNYSQEELPELFQSITDAGVPTFALMGRAYVEMGCLASLAPSNFLPTFARRIALDVLKISEGTDAGDLSVEITDTQEDFVINMNVVRALNLYPDFTVINRATLLQLANIKSKRKITINSAIHEALSNNLDYKSAQKNILIADQDIAISKANLYPQIDVNTSTGIADDNFLLPDGSELRAGNYGVGANLTQLIYAEPVYANIAIQKILKDQRKAEVRQTSLDIVLQTSQSYLNYLQAKNLVRVTNENVVVTKQNLAISQSKNKLGYASRSDVYRLESQLAQNTIDLNAAVAKMKQARYALNQLLNMEQFQFFEIEDVTEQSGLVPTDDDELVSIINNQRDYNLFMDFMVEEAAINLPELEQIQLTIDAQQRLLLSNQRSIYTPQIAFSGGAGKTFGFFNVAKGIELSKTPTWNAGVQVSLPIFQGGLRKANIEQNKVQLDQLDIQSENTRQKFELSLRSNMENLSLAYTSMFLSRQSADAGYKNFEIVQDLYRQGQATIITLIDAQNAYLQADLNATNAVYQYMSSFLSVERDTGRFYFLMSDPERQEWKDRLRRYLIAKQN